MSYVIYALLGGFLGYLGLNFWETLAIIVLVVLIESAVRYL